MIDIDETDIDAVLRRAGQRFQALCPAEHDADHQEAFVLERTIRAAVNAGTCPEVQSFVFESRAADYAARACCLTTHLGMLACYWGVLAERARQQGDEKARASHEAKSARFDYFRMLWAKSITTLGSGQIDRFHQIAFSKR